MNKKELKKEFLKGDVKARNLVFLGAILAVIGLVIVLLTLLFGDGLAYPIDVVIYILGGGIALVGMILEIIGEIKTKKEFNQFLEKQKNSKK